ncbi:MAG: RnfABCDGE type electron transport complex subunit D [Oscillospiraceae bacterium]|nr:RnfABCDGE type electron transport complex subunit D [Oscillospiraceae bacterium]
MKNANEKTDIQIHGNILMCLMVLLGMAVYYYGLRALVTAALSAAVCVFCDFVCVKMRKRDVDFSDLSSLCTGLAIALMMPASVPYYIIVICGVFGTAIVKHCFGGHGCEIFSPACAAYIFAEICYSSEVLSYPKVFDRPDLRSAVSNDLFPSFSKTMQTATTSPVSDYEMLIGRCLSPMGTGIIVLLAVMGIYLMAVRISSFEVFLSQTAVYALSALILGGGASGIKYDICGGMYLFVSIFIICRNAPKTLKGRIIYGICSGALIGIFRYCALAENPAVYAAVIAAPVGIIISDREAQRKEAAADVGTGTASGAE